jgi:hypothetical protein
MARKIMHGCGVACLVFRKIYIFYDAATKIKLHYTK